jgi:ABC-2 type transport system ATP-binding protein
VSANPAEPASADDAVTAEDLTKRFGAFTAVDRLSMRIARGEVMGFIGPNGAGKSTTIRMLCGLVAPSEGRASVAGFDVGSQAQRVREHIGYMSQKFSLYGDLTVRENLRFFAGIYRVPASEVAGRMQYAVSMAGLEGQENARVATLAGGWKQRLALGCAILHRPPVLFLDEPTSGVEPEARRRFWDLIHDLAANGVTTLVSTHYMDEAEYCNRIALIDRGKLIAIGSPSELRQRGLGGVLYELESSPLGAALEALHGVPGILEAAIFGDRLHVVVDSGASSAPDLAGLLRGRGVAVGAIRPTLRGLETRAVG